MELDSKKALTFATCKQAHAGQGIDIDARNLLEFLVLDDGTPDGTPCGVREE